MLTFRHVTNLLCAVSVIVVTSTGPTSADELSLEKALAALPAYEDGTSRAAVIAIDRAVSRAIGQRDRVLELASNLAAVLDNRDATTAARRVVLVQLRRVGGSAQVPALSRLLSGSPDLAEPARQALESIPGPESLDALRAALGKVDGGVLVGVVNSLGRRRDELSVSAVERFVSDGDGDLRVAAIRALGNIADDRAAAILTKMSPPADGPLASALRDARRMCAARRGDRAGAPAAARPKVEKPSERAPFSLHGSAGSLDTPPYGKDAIAKRRAQLAKSAPPGHTLIAYVDCGVMRSDGPADGVNISIAGGRAWRWDDPAAHRAGTLGTVAFDGPKLRFTLGGLDPKSRYAIGWSWWDFDANERSQSVEVVGGSPRREWMLVQRTPLPDHAKRGQKAADWVRSLPQESYPRGRAIVTFTQRGKSNALASELRLYRIDDEKAAAKRRRNVLIVTGIDYPGHDWRATGPVVRKLLEADPETRVDIVDDPAYLASPEIHERDVLVLHFMDWKVPDPGPKARANLKQYVAKGGGLVLVHFACGAFQEWPEFEKIVGRVWDPKLRGHDPRGLFRVDICNHAHAATKGIESFDTFDELYTCLRGNTPIEVLAEATSKVDKKDYPMAFVLRYGKGRVFSTTLGHDVRAFKAPGVGQLLRGGVAWAEADE